MAKYDSLINLLPGFNAAAGGKMLVRVDSETEDDGRRIKILLIGSIPFMITPNGINELTTVTSKAYEPIWELRDIAEKTKKENS